MRLPHLRTCEEAIRVGIRTDVSLECTAAFFTILSPLKHRKFIILFVSIANTLKLATTVLRRVSSTFDYNGFSAAEEMWTQAYCICTCNPHELSTDIQHGDFCLCTPD